MGVVSMMPLPGWKESTWSAPPRCLPGIPLARIGIDELTMRLDWSGVIVRNFGFWFGIKSAIAAVLLNAVLPMGESIAQAPRVALSPQKNTAPKPPASSEQPALVTPPADQFQELLDRAIELTGKRYLTANSHSPWQIFHCILAMRQESLVRLGKEKVNAIQWLSTTEPVFDNEPWMMLTPHGAKFHPYTKKYYFEGHPAQFLALLSQSNLPLTHQFRVQGKIVTLGDMLNNTMKQVNSNEEVTWVLWALQHYLKPDASWLNQANEPWSIERLVQVEAAAPVVGAPCGGNHRLFALTRTRDKYLKNGGQLRGVWLQADQKIKQHIEIARSLQNSDGSFSSASYKGPMYTNDVNDRFNTSGHTMEFLSISLPNERLNETWVRNAVWMLSRELIIHKDTQIDCGPLFHTLDALILYRDRIRPKAILSEAPLPAPLDMAPQVPEKSQTPEKTLAAPSGISLKSSPDPVELQEAPKATPEMKPTDTPVGEAKDAESVAKPNSNSTQEPETSPESKPVEPTQEPLKFVEPQVKAPNFEATSPKPVASSTTVPQIDPAKLANIGQSAPRPVSQKRDPEPIRPPRRDRVRGAAPALLPDLSATPLTNIELSVTTEKQRTDLAETSNRFPSADAERTDDSGGETSCPVMVSDDAEEPASAIAPANAAP